MDVTRPRRLLAVAVNDPFDPGTFSGYSHHLFTSIERRGIETASITTNAVYPSDYLRGAFNFRGIPQKLRGGKAPRYRPNWYWSRAASERFAVRFRRQAARIGPTSHGLQVGTHVPMDVPGMRGFCVTDMTVAQARGAGFFVIGRANSTVVDEAVDWQREVFHSCEKVFVLSQWTADSVVNDYEYPPERVVVVGAGANLVRSLPRDPDPENPYILFVGINWERKGGPLLLEAFREVRRQTPEFRLVVVGCTPSIDEDGVVVLGRLDRKQPRDYRRLLELYAAATCFSIVPVFDPFPNVLLEAGFMGVPVVSTNEGSRPEAIVDGETGLLVPRDADALAAGILKLARDPGLAESMGAAARNRVLEKFTWEHVSARVVQEMEL